MSYASNTPCGAYSVYKIQRAKGSAIWSYYTLPQPTSSTATCNICYVNVPRGGTKASSYNASVGLPPRSPGSIHPTSAVKPATRTHHRIGRIASQYVHVSLPAPPPTSPPPELTADMAEVAAEQARPPRSQQSRHGRRGSTCPPHLRILPRLASSPEPGKLASSSSHSEDVSIWRKKPGASLRCSASCPHSVNGEGNPDSPGSGGIAASLQPKLQSFQGGTAVMRGDVCQVGSSHRIHNPADWHSLSSSSKVKEASYVVIGSEKNSSSGKAGRGAADHVAAAPRTAILKRAPAWLFRPVRPDPHFSAPVNRS
ncbi:unnamed protein product [Pleuronectes platessa]|uniref:Uncharacterized protein n=1 Tax=Pleuronectes platessa TaxID=8262 RepID=A0A9N7U9K2_PLEPL|nr:unnamed protein product [Pleuronectes platessa]